MESKTAKIFAGLVAVSVSIPAVTQERVFTLQGMEKCDTEAIAIAKRSAQDMVARINSQTDAPYDTFTSCGRNYLGDVPPLATEESVA